MGIMGEKMGEGQGVSLRLNNYCNNKYYSIRYAECKLHPGKVMFPHIFWHYLLLEDHDRD